MLRGYDRASGRWTRRRPAMVTRPQRRHGRPRRPWNVEDAQWTWIAGGGRRAHRLRIDFDPLPSSLLGDYRRQRQGTSGQLQTSDPLPRMVRRSPPTNTSQGHPLPHACHSCGLRAALPHFGDGSSCPCAPRTRRRAMTVEVGRRDQHRPH